MSVNEFRLDPRSGDITVERSNGQVDTFSLANTVTFNNGQLLGPAGQPITGGSSAAGFVSVVAAGADPTGVVPCADIVNAILASGQIAYFDPGVYNLGDKCIRLSSGRIDGAGYERVTIRRSGFSAEVIGVKLSLP